MLAFLMSAAVFLPQAVRAFQTDEQRLGRRILATTSLAAKEYAEGVADGFIVASEEVEEARLFLKEARSSVEQLTDGLRTPALPIIDSMLTTVESVGQPAVLSRLADSVASLLHGSIRGLDERIPPFQPDPSVGGSIYASACATCHGDNGLGDGPAAAGLVPPPTDLTAASALSDQTPLDFYRKILIGVSGTAMPAFEGNLSEEEMWEVAWFATRLRYRKIEGARRRDLLGQFCEGCSIPLPDAVSLARLPSVLSDPEEVARASDEDLTNYLRGSNAVDLRETDTLSFIGVVRTLPFATVRAPISAFARARAEIIRGLRLAQLGETDAASAKLFDGYVAFEEVEPDVVLRDNRLASDIEFAFAELRGRLGSGESPETAADSYYTLEDLLNRAEATLGTTNSPLGFFLQSFFLLLREGVEAFLIVAALAALVVRAGAPAAKRAIWWGVWAALGASAATAILIETIFRLGAAQQEILEGGTMLLAACVLLFVSYWLISKIEVTRWKNFLAVQGNRAIRQGSLFALAGAAFLAVYREGFETVLFYKELVITAEGRGLRPTAAGAAVASVALLCLYFGISRFGLKVPIRQFFALTSAILMYMAFSFAGKGIAELQESSIVSTTIIDWAPRVPWMGIYPTTQSLLLQTGILGLIVAGLIWTFGVAPRLSPRS